MVGRAQPVQVEDHRLALLNLLGEGSTAKAGTELGLVRVGNVPRTHCLGGYVAVLCLVEAVVGWAFGKPLLIERVAREVFYGILCNTSVTERILAHR